MFQNDYKNEIDKIKPDGYIKQKIQKQLENKEKPTKAYKKIYFGTAVAAVLCVAIALSAIGIFKNHNPTVQKNEPITLMKTVKNYNGIYSTLEKFKPTFIDNVTDFADGIFNGFDSTEDAAPEAGMEIGDGGLSEGINATTKPDSSQYNNGDNAASEDSDHSETTTQVEGVDEADIVKTDGKFIYILTQNANGTVIKIVDARNGTPKQLSSISVDHMNNQEMYLMNDRLVILGTDYNYYKTNHIAKTSAVIYDISNPEQPKKVETCSQSGDYNTSRLIGNRLYIISDYYVQVDNMKKSDAESFIPSVEANGFCDTVSADSIYLYNECSSPEYTVVIAFDIKDGKMLSSQSVLGGSYTVYSSTENIITASMSNSTGKTQVARFKLDGDNIELVATGELKGSLLNQFSIDEYKDHFRFVLTDYTTVSESVTKSGASTSSYSIKKLITVNSLVILDGDLKETGKITDLAPDERVYSVRFMGDIAYFVTFRQVDPLFSADVSDPKNPKIIGALKIPGFSNYLFPYGDGKLLGIGQNADENTGKTGSIKLSMFNISDPSNVTETDKTDVDSFYSGALYNHKAILCDYNKNIISFAANGYTANQTLYVYSYENGKFVTRLEEDFGANESLVRPMYIGNTFYIVTENEIRYFNLLTFEKLGNIYLS